METYDGPLPKKITLSDTASDINEKVNRALRSARSAGGAVKSPNLETAIYKQLGKPAPPKLWLAPIESWAMDLPKAKPGSSGKIYEPDAADSQYKDMVTVTTIGGLAPVMLVNGILIGTDKLGHFFQLAFSHYYSKIIGPGKMARDDAIKEGDKSEVEMFGLAGTGVYSNADLAANLAGLRFYEDLARSPNMTFDIRTYISDRWNEQSNPNLYGGQVHDIWRKSITGKWAGQFGWRVTPSISQYEYSSCQMELKTTGAKSLIDLAQGIGNIEGKYHYAHPKASFTSGELTGTVTETKNGDGAVIRIELVVDWKEGPAIGKGTFVMTSMNHLDGLWGRRASAVDGGTWAFNKM